MPNWYVMHAYSGFEKKVGEQIKSMAAQKGLSEKIHEVMVPTEEVTEVKRGQKVQTERRFFPGYILVNADMDDIVANFLLNVPKVTGFVGSKGRGKPMPITDAEATRIMQQVQEGVDHPRPSVSFEVGEQVRVSDGPFASFTGNVEGVDEEKGRVKVLISILGRPTPVELEYSQVEKV
ncbi:MAG: transcription termination/antitermination protein NusG [Dongiaceae bacterium]